MNLKIFTHYFFIIFACFSVKEAHAIKIDPNALTISLGTIFIETEDPIASYKFSTFPNITLGPKDNILGTPDGKKGKLPPFDNTIFLPGSEKTLPLFDKNKNNQIILQPLSKDSYFIPLTIQFCKKKYTNWKNETTDIRVTYMIQKNPDPTLSSSLIFYNDLFAQNLTKIIPKKQLDNISSIYGYLINISFNPTGAAVYTDKQQISYSIKIKSIDIQAQLSENAPKNPGGFTTISITFDELLKYPEILNLYPGLVEGCIDS